MSSNEMDKINPVDNYSKVKNKRDGPVKRIIAVVMLFAVFVCIGMMSGYSIKAAYDTWTSLSYLEFRTAIGPGSTALSDVSTYGKNYTMNVSLIKNGTKGRYFDNIIFTDSPLNNSRVTYGKKIRVWNNQNINIVAANQDTADEGGSSINAGRKFYWSPIEYDAYGNIVYDSGWQSTSNVWTVGQTTVDAEGYGSDGYPSGVSQSKRANDVAYIVPVFRWANGNLHEGSGGNLVLYPYMIADSFPVFYLVTSPFTYHFDYNGGSVNIDYNGYKQEESTYDIERLGTSTIDISEATNAQRPGYNLTGWKIKGGTGKQKDKVYTTEQLKTMMSDGKYWSSLFENATFEAQWELKSYNLTFNPNGGSLKYPGSNINNPNGNTSDHVTVTYTKGDYCDMSADIPYMEGQTFVGWYLYHNDNGNEWWEQIYDKNGYAVKQNTSCFWYWNGSYAWHYDGDVTLYAAYEVNNYTLKLDADYYTQWFDKLKGDINGNKYDLGSVDLYINGNLEAENITDWNKEYPYGTTYEFKNLKSKNGYVLSDAGSLKGTIKGDTTAITYVYDKVGLAYFDKNSSAGGQGTDRYVRYSMVDLVYDKGVVLGNDFTGFTNIGKMFRYWKTDKSNYYNGGDVMPVNDDYQAKAYIQNKNSNLVMDIAWGGMSNDSGLNIQLADAWGGNGEYWSFTKAATGDDDYFIVNATVKTGYNFYNWTDGSGNEKSKSIDYTFTMPASNVTLKDTGCSTTNSYKITAN